MEETYRASEQSLGPQPQSSKPRAAHVLPPPLISVVLRYFRIRHPTHPFSLVFLSDCTLTAFRWQCFA